MPRVHIHLHDIEEIEELEQREDWEQQLGLDGQDPRRELRRDGNFGGAEARERRRAERRKHVVRSSRRI